MTVSCRTSWLIAGCLLLNAFSVSAGVDYGAATYVETKDGVTLTARALTVDQSKKIFGQDVLQEHIYPVEVTIQNVGQNSYILTKPFDANFDSLENSFYVSNVITKSRDSFANFIKGWLPTFATFQKIALWVPIAGVVGAKIVMPVLHNTVSWEDFSASCVKVAPGIKGLSSEAVATSIAITISAITFHKMLDNVQDGLSFANVIDLYGQKENVRIKQGSTTKVYLFINKNASWGDQLHYTFKMKLHKNDLEQTRFEVKLPKVAL